MSLLLTLLLGLAHADTLVLEIQGVRSTEGQLLVVVYRGPDGFPGKPDAAAHAARVVPAAPTTTVEIPNVAPGEYAVSVVHDENRNDALDVGRLFPIPTEPVGCSRDAKARMGPPRYEDAAFTVSGSGRHVERFTLKHY